MSSRLMQFRISDDSDSDEEKQAMEVLDTYRSNGFSDRQIGTWALMALAGESIPQQIPVARVLRAVRQALGVPISNEDNDE